jgi:hypothetical protein
MSPLQQLQMVLLAATSRLQMVLLVQRLMALATLLLLLLLGLLVSNTSAELRVFYQCDQCSSQSVSRSVSRSVNRSKCDQSINWCDRTCSGQTRSSTEQQRGHTP